MAIRVEAKECPLFRQLFQSRHGPSLTDAPISRGSCFLRGQGHSFLLCRGSRVTRVEVGFLILSCQGGEPGASVASPPGRDGFSGFGEPLKAPCHFFQTWASPAAVAQTLESFLSLSTQREVREPCRFPNLFPHKGWETARTQEILKISAKGKCSFFFPVPVSSSPKHGLLFCSHWYTPVTV